MSKYKSYLKWVGLVLVVAMIAFGVGRCTGGDEQEEEEAAEEEEGASEYTCPMHPQIREPEMGTCPICHMDLVPVDEANGGEDEVPAVRLSEGAQRLAQVQMQEVEVGPVRGELDVFGRLEVNEDAEIEISAWTGGRIEELRVRTVGEEIRRGQLLARVYSPEVLSAQKSLVQALKNRDEAEAARSDRRQRAATSAVEAARMELRLLGLEAQQIDDLEESREPRETIDVFATASGTVQERFVTSGDYVDTGDPILALAALDTLWAQLEIDERHLSRVSEGMPVSIEVPAMDGEALEGRIEFISPRVDRRSRVALARVALDSQGGFLRPGMYVGGHIEVAQEGEEVISVADSAVLWTGKRSLVYRYDTEIDPSGFVAQPVKLGPKMGERRVIEEGLEPGDRVATRGAFRLDAELQIRSGPTMMSRAHDTGASPLSPEDTVEVPDEGIEFDPPIDAEQLPDGVWYCDMGTTHWAQPEKGDDECPICGMRLTEKEGEDHDHNHDHDGDQDNGGGHEH